MASHACCVKRCAKRPTPSRARSTTSRASRSCLRSARLEYLHARLDSGLRPPMLCTHLADTARRIGVAMRNTAAKPSSQLCGTAGGCTTTCKEDAALHYISEQANRVAHKRSHCQRTCRCPRRKMQQDKTPQAQSRRRRMSGEGIYRNTANKISQPMGMTQQRKSQIVNWCPSARELVSDGVTLICIT